MLQTIVLPSFLQTSDLDLTSHGFTVELKVVREEKEKLMSNLSLEQANVIDLKSKLMECQEILKTSNNKVEHLTSESKQNESNLKKEMENYKLEAERYRTILIEKEKEFYHETENQVQNAIKKEQSKGEEKLNIVLYELKKVNGEVITLKMSNDVLETELNQLKIEHKVIKEKLEKKELELENIDRERLEAESKLECERKDIDQVRNEILDNKRDLEEKTKTIESANVDIEKLRVQLEEKEKTIASFQAHDGHFAEILQMNTQAGDALQKEKEYLLKQIEDQGAEIQEMKKQREIIAKKLKVKVHLYKVIFVLMYM